MAWSPSTRLSVAPRFYKLATSGSDHNLRLFSSDLSGQNDTLRVLKGHRDYVNSIAFHPNWQYNQYLTCMYMIPWTSFWDELTLHIQQILGEQPIEHVCILNFVENHPHLKKRCKSFEVRLCICTEHSCPRWFEPQRHSRPPLTPDPWSVRPLSTLSCPSSKCLFLLNFWSI